MGTNRDITPERDATVQELQQYETAQAHIRQLDRSNTYNSSNPNQRLFFVAFDGTRNDRESPDSDYVHTNPDLLQALVPRSANVESQYVNGVATRNESYGDELREAVTGDGSEKRAKQAYENLVEQVHKWHKDNPNVEVHISTVGFSRGTGSQRHFANLVHERGIPNPDGEGYLIPPGQVYQDLMLMYDSVLTGKEGVLKSAVPSSVTNAVHLTADHENRVNFDLASIVDPFNPNDPGIFEFGLPGSHSDVGGGSDYQGLSSLSLALGHDLMGFMGVPIGEVSEKNRFSSDNAVIHDSGQLLKMGSLDDMVSGLGNWEFGEREIFAPGNPSRRSTEQQEQAEFAARQQALEEAAEREATAVREAEISVVSAGITLRNAIAQGDDLEIAEAMIDYLLASSNYAQYRGGGGLGDSTSSAFSIAATSLGLYDAIEGDDLWNVASESMQLLEDINNFMVSSGIDVDGILDSDGMKALDFAQAVVGLGQAIDSGDELQIAGSSIQLISAIDGYVDFNLGSGLGNAASFVSLATNLASFEEVWESGDTGAITQSTLSIINDGVKLYDGLTTASGSSIGSSYGSYLGKVAVVIGVIQGIADMLDGNTQAGAEQIAITTATYGLSFIPVWGWAAAIVLQIGNATRGCDGRLIDRENIREFTDEIAPAGSEVAAVYIDGIEVPAGLVTDVSDGVTYWSAFNVDMYDDLNIDIPEEMQAEFNFFQTVNEANNPLRFFKYFEDLEEVSLSDIWDATYITQSIAATLDQLDNHLDFLDSSFNDTDDILEDMVQAVFSSNTYEVLIDNFFGNDEPPSATAGFIIDENGQITVTVSGEEALQEAAQETGDALKAIVEQYRNRGGRVNIDANLPSLVIASGQTPRINYTSEYGGRVSVDIKDPNKLGQELRAVLVARDRGDRIDDAVKVARNSQGVIDTAKMDGQLAAMGFTKRGITYTMGESNTPQIQQSYGSGIYNGGGNAGGPQGRHFTAKNSDIVSLPLQPDQHPSRTVGRVLETVSLRHNFAGTSGRLLAMGLGVNTAPAFAESTELSPQRPVNDAFASKPLNLDFYSQQEGGHLSDEWSGIGSEISPDNIDQNFHSFLQSISPGLVSGLGPLENYLESVEFTSQPDIDYSPLSSFSSVTGIDWGRDRWVHPSDRTDQPERTSQPETGNQPDAAGQPRQFDSAPVSTPVTNLAITPDQLPSGFTQPALRAGTGQGTYFVMAEDSSLRFLDSDLTRGPVGEAYSSSLDDYQLISFGNEQHGTVYRDINGDIRFEAEAGFVGTASFEYFLQGPNGEQITSRALIIVQDVNDPPLLTADHFTISEGEPFYLDQLLQNDTDIEGDQLSLDHFRGLEHGELGILNNRLVFVPEAGFSGTIEFSYFARDRADAYPQMAKASLTVVDQNIAPEPTEDRFIILEDQPLLTSADRLLANDLEHDGESLRVVSVQGESHGTVNMSPNGTITFIPESDYTGLEAGFSYIVEDGSSHQATGRAVIEVLDSREPPVVVSDVRAAITQHETITFTPDEINRFVIDPDGDLLYLDFVDNVVGGQMVLENGYYSFVPGEEFSGTASFDYRANDNHRGTVEGTVSFEVLAVNDPVVVGEDFQQTLEELPLSMTVADLLANDADPEGSSVHFVRLGDAAHGTVALGVGDTIVFTPDPDYQGAEAGFQYVVSDEEGLESSGFVHVEVADVGDAPVVVSHSLTIEEDQEVVFSGAVVDRFVKDADGDSLEFTAMAAVNGGGVREEGGQYIFTPDQDYFGTASITYTVTDNNGFTLDSSLDIEILPVNDPVDFGNDFLHTWEETPVSTTVTSLMANDSDPDGFLVFSSLGGAVHGSVTMNPDGTITFSPDTDYSGPEAGFQYLVTDSAGVESAGFVTVEVTGVNDVPTLTNQSLTTPEDHPIVFDQTLLTTLVSDADGDTLKVTTVVNVMGGTVREQGGVYSFIPEPNYSGPGSFDCTVSDTNGGEVALSLSIDIQAQDDPTNFGDDTLFTVEETAVTVTVAELLANDSDEDGQPEFVSLGATVHGNVEMGTNGVIAFTPDQDYSGSNGGFEYLVRDGAGNQATGFVRVEVENVNDAPVVSFDRLHIQEDERIVFTSDEISGFISDPDDDSLNFSSIANVTHGSLQLNGGIYTFTPDADYYGEASFDYTVSDGQGGEVGGSLYMDISPVNDVPTVTGLSATVIEDHELTIGHDQLMTGAVDVEDGTDVQFDTIVSSQYGDAWLDDSGLVHFLADDDFFGSASFDYAVLDSEGGVGTARVEVTVLGENDIPVAVDDDHIPAWSNNGYDNVYLSSSFLANDYDVDLDSLSIVSLGPAEFGTAYLDGSGNVHYQAAEEDWVGVDSFTYTIDDGHGGLAQATAQVDVRLNTSPDVYPEILFSREDVITLITQQELLGNDSDVDGDSLFVSAVGNAAHGSVTLLNDGRVRFIPESNFNNNYPGQASFEYTVSDGISDPVTATAFVNLSPVNDAPILRGEQISGAVEDNSFSFTAAQLMANDTDVEMASPYEQDSIHFNGVTGASHGTISYHPASGVIYYNPDPDFNGIDTFQYQISDSHGSVSVGTSEIYVQPVNDNPVAQEDFGSTAETMIWNMYSVSGLLGNDFDVDGDSLSIVNPYVSSGSANVRLSGGYLQVQPLASQSHVEVSYTVSDGHGGTAPSKLTLPDIVEHNFAPTFSGIYQISWETNDEVFFNFHAEDRNGGNTWSNDPGDIVSISASAVSSGRVWDDGFAFKFMGNVDTGSLVLTVMDQAGATGSIFVEMSHLQHPNGNHVYSPVVLDLDGDGVELLDISAGVAFDWNRDTQAEASGWVAADDGFLVYDYNHDHLVTKGDELMLREYLPGAETDLEGLQAFDSNDDGMFGRDDSAWHDFGVWQDGNSNGVTDDGEFQGLDELGITAIELESNGVEKELSGNIVYGSARYHLEDETTMEVGDVALRGEDVEFVMVDMEGPGVGEAEGDQTLSFGNAKDLSSLERVAGEVEADTQSEAESSIDQVAENIGKLPQPEAAESDTEQEEIGETVETADTIVEQPIDLLQVEEAEINRLAQQLQSDAAAGYGENNSAQEDVYVFVPDAVLVMEGESQSDQQAEDAILVVA